MDYFDYDLDFYELYKGKEAPLVGYVNRALLDFVLDALRIHGYEPRNVIAGDEYFLFRHYPNSRNEFRLSRVLPGWRFGLWIEGEALLCQEWDEDVPVMQLFAQHDTQIDKCKPAASDILLNVYLGELNSVLEGNYRTDFVKEPFVMRQIGDLADQIRLHPALSYQGVMGVCGYPLTGHPLAEMVRGIARYHRDRALGREI